MQKKTRVNITIRPGDLAMLDLLADFQGLTRGQMVESLARAEALAQGAAWGDTMKKALGDAAARAEERGR